MQNLHRVYALGSVLIILVIPYKLAVTHLTGAPYRMTSNGFIFSASFPTQRHSHMGYISFP
ncbi:hypothetical protein BROOK1789C_761 [Bathymodiolus brooksi thiotrophic gill symbiont]|nr:hypothetical protein BROOK1789C_761 [Bathymodiolus brooksi thiotrophic gill symbiont]